MKRKARTSPAPWRDRIVGLRRVRAGDLLPDKRNWRRHPEAQRSALLGVLKEVGWADALLARETPEGLVLVDGHLRAGLDADTVVPVLVLDLDEAEAGKVIATLDPLASMAAPDQEALSLLLQTISFQDGAVNDMLEALANGSYQTLVPMPDKGPKAGLTDPDDVPEAPAKPWVKRGDVFQLGENRVMCGDSTQGEDVEKLMARKKATCCFTSPPYFNQRDYSQWSTYDDYLLWADQIVRHLPLGNDAIVGLNVGSDEQAHRWMPSDWWCLFRDAGWIYQESFAWVKAAAVWSVPRSMHIENGHYFPAQRWEIILTVKRGKHPSFDMEDRDRVREFQDNVWEVAVVSGNEQTKIGHPAIFPCALPERFIMAYTVKGNLAFDPFLGSGTTLIACERLGRICYSMEIEPRYVQVSLERWENYTGRKAVKVGNGDPR